MTWKRSNVSDIVVWQAYQKAQEKDGFTTTYVMELLLGIPEKVVEAKLQQLVDRGLWDYGVSLHSGWWEGEVPLLEENKL